MGESLTSFAIGTFLALFPIANPVGAVPVFYSLTKQNSALYRRYQARWVAINVIWILLLFLVSGRALLSFFGISLGVLRIAGGLLVVHTAWEMVTARQRLTPPEHQEAVDMEDISFIPMAIPLVSGPGAIGVVIGLSAQIRHPLDYVGCLLGIVLLGTVLYLCLSLGAPLVKALGKNGLGALNRILGFFILAIGVQLIADGAIVQLKEATAELFP